MMSKIGGVAYLRDKVISNKKIIPLLRARVIEILGKDSVQRIKYLQNNAARLGPAAELTMPRWILSNISRYA